MAEEVRAPLAGNVLEILVESGAKVEEDDDLLIIEALKMENVIAAPRAGKVARLHVKAGDTVSQGRELVELE